MSKLDNESIKKNVKAVFLDPEIKAKLLKALEDSKAEIEEDRKRREVKWVCTCHNSDFCILHTRFI